MTDPREFETQFEAALAERNNAAEWSKLAALCKKQTEHGDRLQQETENRNPRRALLAKATILLRDKQGVVSQVFRYLTKSLQVDLYPGGQIRADSDSVPWAAKAVVKYVGPEAIIPLLEIEARYPESRIAEISRLALLRTFGMRPSWTRPCLPSSTTRATAISIG
jgi:hypothetical protein